jgi:hypothetical protein
MNFDAFIEQAWTDHGDLPEDVAQRLEQGYALIDKPAHFVAFARILAHVDGEHLAHWQQGVARLERLRAHARWSGDGDAAVIVRRLIAALRVAETGEAPEALDAAERAHAHAVAAAALLGQKQFARALRHFRAALAAATSGLPERDPAIRAVAAASNNLAAALEEKSPRDADETRAMLDAARAGREFWERAGTWLETERAEYMLAKCLLTAGNAKEALVHAGQCVALCERNGADDFERFFAQGVLALSRRACGDPDGFEQAKHTALAHHARLAADRKTWCEPTLQLLS